MIIEYCLETAVCSGVLFGGRKVLQSIAIKRANRSMERARAAQEPDSVPLLPQSEKLIEYRMVEKFDSLNGRQRFTAQYKRKGRKDWTDIDYWWDKEKTLETIKNHKIAEIREKQGPIIHEVP